MCSVQEVSSSVLCLEQFSGILFRNEISGYVEDIKGCRQTENCLSFSLDFLAALSSRQLF